MPRGGPAARDHLPIDCASSHCVAVLSLLLPCSSARHILPVHCMTREDVLPLSNTCSVSNEEALRRFNEARVIAGLPPSLIEADATMHTSTLQRRLYEDFYSLSNGPEMFSAMNTPIEMVQGWPTPKVQGIAYGRLPRNSLRNHRKCPWQNATDRYDRAAVLALAVYFPVLKAGNNFWRHNFHTQYSSVWSANAELANDARMPIVRFTFVREPLERFISGLTEAMWRGHVDLHCPIPRAPKRPKAGSEFATLCKAAVSPETLRRTQVNDPSEAFHNLIPRLFEWLLDGMSLTHVLTPIQSTLNHISHTYAMIGMRRKHPAELDFVGRMEYASHGWQGLNRLLNGKLPPYERLDHASNEHMTSHDYLGHRASIVQYLRSHPKVRKAICHLLEPDYSCFRYDHARCMSSPLVHHAGGRKNETQRNVTEQLSRIDTSVLGRYGDPHNLATHYTKPLTVYNNCTPTREAAFWRPSLLPMAHPWSTSGLRG